MAHRLVHDTDRLPLGHFVSITTRDANGRSRNGQPYFAWNALECKGPRQYEIQFADGDWMLCDAVEMHGGYFDLDTIRPRSWPAVEFGRPWNGWATPVVARTVLESVLTGAREPYVWDADTILVGDEAEPLRPRPDGLYDLALLGFCFEFAGPSRTRD